MLFFKKSFTCLVIIYSSLYFSGCTQAQKEKEYSFLMKTSLEVVTCSDFSEELDLKKAAYPYNINKNPVEYNEMVMALAADLSLEIVLLSAAADKGVIVTDMEIELAEKEFKKDYPEDSFDEILLNNAISYFFWKKQFRENMIVKKFINQEIKQKIEITSQDIAEFYKKKTLSQSGYNWSNTKGLTSIEKGKQLLSRLRMQKIEERYDEWISELKKDYPVKINKKKLQIFLTDIGDKEENKNEKET